MFTHRNEEYSSGFTVTLIMLPAIIAVIILLVGNNVARAFSLAGAFSLIRFRSAPGDSKDIAYVFFTLGVGLACGMGYIGYAVLFAAILCGAMAVLTKLRFGSRRMSPMRLKIAMPEDMDYQGVFDGIFEEFAEDSRLNKVKTTEFGSLFEITYDIFKPFMDGVKKPLNVMEVSNLWSFLVICDNTLRNEEVAYNNAQNSELKQLLLDAKKIHQTTADEITKLLKDEGIPLPQDTPEKPLGDFRNIPEGVGLNDEEIANLMSYNLVLGINYSSRGLTESIRADVGLLFFKVVIKKTAIGLKLKQFLDTQNWLRVPPYFKS
jgi:hypothetical protein